MVSMSTKHEGFPGYVLSLKRGQIPETDGVILPCRSQPAPRRGKGQGKNLITMAGQQCYYLSADIVMEAYSIALSILLPSQHAPHSQPLMLPLSIGRRQ